MSLLKPTEWIAFDLDDTIHNFRHASTVAAQAIFTQIHQHHKEISISTLQADYRAILASHTANAFSDGKSSTEYRRERFAALLRGRGIESSEQFMQGLLSIYKDSLAAALSLKPGALETMQGLKKEGKVILVISEGPRDAQEWTVQRLGIAPYIDILVTSNEIGKTKDEGLVDQVIRDAGLDPRRGIYVGDNKQRDVLPAVAEGIRAVHYQENLDGDVESDFGTDGYISVKSWDMLASLFGLDNLEVG